jgi:hypothetical protein
MFLVLATVSVAACSDVHMPSLGGMFGGGTSDSDSGGNGDGINILESRKANPNAPTLKYAASIHLVPYVDERKTDNPRKIGTGAENVAGMKGKFIVLDQNVANVVTSSIKQHFDDAGFQISEADDGKAQFELSGAVKDLTYNVKYRDEVSIQVESTLKEKSTGKVLWSGLVVEKASRFAGVSGNDTSDVAAYLKKELGIVSTKTTEAISSVLMAVHPELFNLTPGTRPIPGVTVLVAPSVVPSAAAPAAAGQQPAAGGEVPLPAVEAHATATSGLLLVNTNPQRAKVFVDDVYYGLSPLRVSMDPGVHTLSVKLEGYRMVSEKVSVRKGDNTEVQLDLER